LVTRRLACNFGDDCNVGHSRKQTIAAPVMDPALVAAAQNLTMPDTIPREVSVGETGLQEFAEIIEDIICPEDFEWLDQCAAHCEAQRKAECEALCEAELKSIYLPSDIDPEHEEYFNEFVAEQQLKEDSTATYERMLTIGGQIVLPQGAYFEEVYADSYGNVAVREAY